MPLKHGLAQIIKLPSTCLTLVSLAMGLVSMKPALVDVARLAIGATNSIRPAQRADGFKAFGVINQVLDV